MQGPGRESPMERKHFCSSVLFKKIRLIVRCSASPKIASCLPFSPGAVRQRELVSAGEISDMSVCSAAPGQFISVRGECARFQSDVSECPGSLFLHKTVRSTGDGRGLFVSYKNDAIHKNIVFFLGPLYIRGTGELDGRPYIHFLRDDADAAHMNLHLP